LRLREWIFIIALFFVSFWQCFISFSLFDQLLLMANTIELILFCLFLLLGGTLFEKATARQLMRVALAIGLMTFIDYYLLKLKITHMLSLGGGLVDPFKSDRGAFILSTEASYWGLTLLGFYAYCLARKWWAPTLMFAFLMVLNHSIYAVSFFALLTFVLLPPRYFMPLVFLTAAMTVFSLQTGLFPLRLKIFFLNLLSNKYDFSNLLTFVESVESEYGSRRFSNVIKSVMDAKLWGPQFTVQPYSGMSQLISVYGWVMGIGFMLWLTVLTVLRYQLRLLHTLFLIVLLVIAGPVSIPFMYAYLFGLSPPRKTDEGALNTRPGP
jgi:hypothetical protein